MSEPESFDDVMGRLRSGDEDAAAEVFNRFAGRLIGLARTRLDTRVRRKVDPEDVMQSVFRSFFVRQAKGQFDLGGWDSLWNLLVRITLRKCGRQIKAFHTKGRDVGREMSAAVSDQTSHRQWEAIAREPTPEEAVSLTDSVERIMRDLDERRQKMLVLRLQRFTVPEISQQVGCTERTVHRVLGKVRESLQRLEHETTV